MAVYESKLARSRSCNPRALIGATTMIMAAVVLINVDRCQASVLLKMSNDTYRCTSGECLIAEDMELEWLMDFSSHATRVLQGAVGHGTGTGNTGKRDEPACPTVNGGKSQCNPNRSPNQNNCGSRYNRNCQPN